MSSVTISGNPSGSGTFTVQSPNSNTSRTITLPDATTTLVGTDATQTLTNKTIQGGAITLDTAKTATGTTVDFTGIPSWVKRITVLFGGVSTSGTSHILLQIGDSGGIEATGYAGGAGASTSSGVTGANSVASGYEIESGNTSAAAVRHGTATISLLDGNTWVAHGVVGSPTFSGVFSFGGSKTLSGTLDRIRVTTVNGTDTFDAGTINIMYEG